MPLPTGDILTETFDNTTDYDNSGWATFSGTVDPNYTGTVLEGTQSLRITTNGTTESVVHQSISARSSVYMYFMFRIPSLPADNALTVALLDGAFGNYLTRLYVHTSGAVFLLSGSSFSGTSVTTLSANTTYHFWLTYIKGTGANGGTNAGFSTDGVRPTSGNNYVEITDSSVTANVSDLYLQVTPVAGTSFAPIFDRVVLNTTQIGDATAATNVSVDLTGVAANPQIGAGTVTIGSAPVEPPVSPGGGTSGRPARTGMRLRPAEDKSVYLKGVAASPRVGQVMVLSEMRGVYEKYVAPIRRVEAQKTPKMPAGMRGLFKKVEKPIPPAVFVYQVGLPKFKSAIGTGKVNTFYEDIDEETIAMIDLL